LFDDLFVGTGGFFVPLPGVLEGGDLGGGAGAVLFGEEDVVVLTGVEGRVEVDKIDGLVAYITLEDVVVIAVEELVLFFVLGVTNGSKIAQETSHTG